jgi:hypothetical protein
MTFGKATVRIIAFFRMTFTILSIMVLSIITLMVTTLSKQHSA